MNDYEVTRGARWLNGEVEVILDIVMPKAGSRLPFTIELQPGCSDLQIEFIVQHLDAAYMLGFHHGVDCEQRRPLWRRLWWRLADWASSGWFEK